MRPDYLFLASDGDLFDTRRPDWSKHPIRPGFSRTHRTIRNGRELRETLRAGPYAWPGGYTIALYTSDGEMASPGALVEDRAALYQALYDIRHKISGRIVGADIYYEGPVVQCCYTNADIASAYGDPDEKGA